MLELISPFQSELDAITSNQTRSSVTPSPETSHQPSANTLVQLVEELSKRLAVIGSSGEAALITRKRHRQALEASLDYLCQSLRSDVDLEIRSEFLRRAGDELGKIVGRIDVEDLLDVIFSEFCVGK